MSGLQNRIHAAADLRASGAPQNVDDAGFDLLANPFILLRVATNASAQMVKQAYEDAIEDGLAPADVLGRAQQCLLSPKLRVDAEVGGLLGVEPGLAGRVVAKLRSAAGWVTLSEEIRELDALPRSNLAAHLGARMPGLDAMLHLLHAQAAVVAGRVIAAIGAAREAASTAKADVATIELALAQLAEQQARAVVYASSRHVSFATTVATLVERTLVTQHAAAIDRLDLYVRVYGQASASELSRRREKVMAACEAQRRKPASGRAAKQVISALSGWAEIVLPLQLYEAYRNRDDAASREVYQQIRSLYIWLFNQNRQFDIAQRLSKACVDLFRHVPGALAQARQDCAAFELADTNHSQQRDKRIVGAIVVGLVVVVQAVTRLTSTSSPSLPHYVPVAPSYQPTSPSAAYQPMSPSAYSPWPQSLVRAPSPRSQPSVRQPDVPAPPPTRAYGAEEKPAIGVITGSLANLRYCTFQLVRVDAMWALVKTPVDRKEVSGRVEDWRSRCNQLRGNPDDQRIIDREFPTARLGLEAEGRALFRQWREDNASDRTRDAAGH